jgi:rhodanese-related sulfurtransferase
MEQISATELSERLAGDGSKPFLLDVREPIEFKFCRIDGSQNIPMNEIAAGLEKLDPQQEIVVICHHGMRSAQVATFLLNNGFPKIINLRGGVAAWASEVDKQMPTY